MWSEPVVGSSTSIGEGKGFANALIIALRVSLAFADAGMVQANEGDR